MVRGWLSALLSPAGRLPWRCGRLLCVTALPRFGVPVVAGLDGEAVGVEAGEDASCEDGGLVAVEGVDAEFDGGAVAVDEGCVEGDGDGCLAVEGPADVVEDGRFAVVGRAEGHAGVDGVVGVEGRQGVEVVVGPAVLPGVGEALGGGAGVHGADLIACGFVGAGG